MSTGARDPADEAEREVVWVVRFQGRDIFCLMNTPAVRRVLGGVSSDTVEREVANGRLKSVLVRSSRMFALGDVLDYIDRCRQ